MDHFTLSSHFSSKNKIRYTVFVFAEINTLSPYQLIKALGQLINQWQDTLGPDRNQTAAVLFVQIQSYELPLGNDHQSP